MERGLQVHLRRVGSAAQAVADRSAGRIQRLWRSKRMAGSLQFHRSQPFATVATSGAWQPPPLRWEREPVGWRPIAVPVAWPDPIVTQPPTWACFPCRCLALSTPPLSHGLTAGWRALPSAADHMWCVPSIPDRAQPNFGGWNGPAVAGSLDRLHRPRSGRARQAPVPAPNCVPRQVREQTGLVSMVLTAQGAADR